MAAGKARNGRQDHQTGLGELHFTAAERRHAERVVELVGPIVPALAEALAPRTEVVLHDLTKMPHTIAAIGGSITGRKVGGPPTDLGVKTFRSGPSEHLISYRTETDGGLVMRSSSIFFRSASGKGVACLCINSDLNDVERAHRILGAMLALKTQTDEQPTANDKPVESFATSVDTLTEGILRDAIDTVGVPLEWMKKSHKVSVVRELEARGFFTIREAVEVASRKLKVSRYTIYNYLNEVLAERDSAPAEGP
jgi:predicted transcriptional regulator YheO